MSDEDATSILARMSAALSRACRARGIWRTTRHTDKRAATLYTAAALRPTNQLSEDVARVGENATRKLLPWNSNSTRDMTMHAVSQ